MLVAHVWDEIVGEWSKSELDLPNDCDPRRIAEMVSESGWEFENSALCGSVLLITIRSDRGHLAIVVITKMSGSERMAKHADI